MHTSHCRVVLENTKIFYCFWCFWLEVRKYIFEILKLDMETFSYFYCSKTLFPANIHQLQRFQSLDWRKEPSWLGWLSHARIQGNAQVVEARNWDVNRFEKILRIIFEAMFIFYILKSVFDR